MRLLISAAVRFGERVIFVNNVSGIPRHVEFFRFTEGSSHRF
jgi:hypothetical protein